jgi:hypothetical protein
MRLIRKRPDSVSALYDLIEWRYVAFVLLPLAGGAGLVLHILIDSSLPLVAATIVLLGLAVWILLIPRLQPPLRRQIRARVWAGAVAGALATGAYDLTRYGVVALFSYSFRPFHVLRPFGELFLGPGASLGSAYTVGLAYHVSNGIAFGITYALLFRRPSLLTGMVWGVSLELCMALLYPSWLRITALGEFLQVSAAGHLIYGAVLGIVLRRLLRVSSTAQRSP